EPYLVFELHQEPRVLPGQADEEITVCLDVTPYLDKKREATVEAHRSQYEAPPFGRLDEEARWKALSTEYFYLAHSFLEHRRAKEDDLFQDVPAPD
ncbi:MAG: hypothetical protein ACE5Q6_12175, partial [Dehalococcoidia bacterium]